MGDGAHSGMTSWEGSEPLGRTPKYFVRFTPSFLPSDPGTPPTAVAITRSDAAFAGGHGLIRPPAFLSKNTGFRGDLARANDKLIL